MAFGHPRIFYRNIVQFISAFRDIPIFLAELQITLSAAVILGPHFPRNIKQTHFCSFKIVRVERPFFIDGNSAPSNAQRSFQEFAV